MELPFEKLIADEPVIVGGIPMLKRGSLKIGEMQAASEIQDLLKGMEDLTAIARDILLKQHIATILIRSRVNKEWTLADTQAETWNVKIKGKAATIEPDMQMMDELLEFFMNEQRRWKPQPEAEPGTETPKKSIGVESIGESG